MSYGKQNVIPEKDLKQIVTGENDAKIKKLTDRLAKMYEDTNDNYDENNDYTEFHELRADIALLRKTLSEQKMPDWRNMMQDDQKIWIQKVIDANLFTPTHGYGFHWLGSGYRNEGLWFWDKNLGLITPCTEYDDYGGVPEHFLVGNGKDQFPPDTWKNVVDHNNYVFLAPELLQEIKDTAKQFEYRKDFGYMLFQGWHTSVVIREHAYCVTIYKKDINKINNLFTFEDGALFYEH